MKQEEAVFGPLLKENFERKELEDMNETVLRQHTFFRDRFHKTPFWPKTFDKFSSSNFGKHFGQISTLKQHI
jgi:hypothetical protein